MDQIHSELKITLDKYNAFMNDQEQKIENIAQSENNVINTNLTEDEIEKINKYIKNVTDITFRISEPLIVETIPAPIKIDTIDTVHSEIITFKYQGFTSNLYMGKYLEKQMAKIVSQGTTFTIMAIKINSYIHVLTFKNTCKFHYKKTLENMARGESSLNNNSRNYICNGKQCCAKNTNILCGGDNNKCCIPYISYKYNISSDLNNSFRTVKHPYVVFKPSDEQYNSFTTELHEIIESFRYRSNKDITFLRCFLLMVQN